MKYTAFNIALAGVLASLLLAACNLEKEVEIQLPDYEPRYVLECYLEPGQPYSLLLSRSAPFFAPLPSFDQDFLREILEQGADVAILYNGVEIKLENRLVFNPVTGKLFNYYSDLQVPYDTINPFNLLITTMDGQTITASARILPVVPIDSMVVQFAENDTLARVLTYITDNPNQENFYRRTLHSESLDSLALQDFVLNDNLVDNQVIAFGTFFGFAKGDKVIATIYHLEEQHFKFLESLQDAEISNGNPFAQPSPIISNLGGTADALGIFTGLSYDRATIIIE